MAEYKDRLLRLGFYNNNLLQHIGVTCGIKAFGIEAIGVDLVAEMVTIPIAKSVWDHNVCV